MDHNHGNPNPPTNYNLNNPSVKRIMKEMKEMEKEQSGQFDAMPLEDNLFEWHFTIKGPRETAFEGGIYHGRIILPAEYPFKPPNIVLLTPNGRFEVGKKICLTISAHHPEHWQPGWSIRTVLIALIGFMPTKGDGAIGALDYNPEERKELAKKSKSWRCERCGPIVEILPEQEEDSQTVTTVTTEKKEIKFPDVVPAKKVESISTPHVQAVHVQPPVSHSTPNPQPTQTPQPTIFQTQALHRSHTSSQNVQQPSQNVQLLQQNKDNKILDTFISILLFGILLLLLKKLFS